LKESKKEIIQSRQSISQLHVEMLQKLLENESKYEKELQEKSSALQQFKEKIDYYKQAYENEKKRAEDVQVQLQEKQTALMKYMETGQEDVVTLKQHIMILNKQLSTEREKTEEIEKKKIVVPQFIIYRIK